MLWLVKPDFAAAGKLQTCDGPPPLFVNLGTGHALLSECGHLRFQVVAQEIEFVRSIFFGGMERGLARRQRKDEPAVPGVDRLEAENIAEKGAVGIGVLAVDDY